MNTPLSWIKAYVPGLDCTDQEYSDKMTLSGTKVEGFEWLDKNLEKIVVGRILSIEKHPDADKLVVCQVDIGTETIQIVTGAPNVAQNQLVPVVLDGGRVVGGHDGGPLPEKGIKIKAGKLRGIESNGMMCAIEELGHDSAFYPDAPEDGIYVFPEGSVEPGMDAVEALGLHDTDFEYEITSNRVDCYSVLGIAREAAVTFDRPFEPPIVVVNESEQKTADMIAVSVEAPDLCSRYVARVCTDVKIGPSPRWMQQRLANSGIRPINNLVDITNYVMLEYGQPMHAYDLDTIAGRKIIVKRAADGEQFQTLDGQMRTLDQDVLMICDAEKEIGIAGIMGGENSKITDEVKTVLFEAATFDGTNIRKSAKRIGLRTDASGIFEKGLDPNNAMAAMNRACQLMDELGCGRVAQGAVDVCEPIAPPVRIPFEPERINALLGTSIAADEMLEIFTKLELGYDAQKREMIVPSFRQDLKQTCDLAEEVARFTGYDNVPMTLPASSATRGGVSDKMRVLDVIEEVARFSGFSESMTYSFESPKCFDKLMLAQDAPERQAIRIANPLGEDFSVMRTTPLNGMLTSLSTNYNRRNKDVRLFEAANIYIPHELPLEQLPDERGAFTLGMYGEDADFFTMKGVVEEIFAAVGMKKKTVCDPDSGKPFLHPGRQANLVYDGKVVGYLGEVHPQVLDSYDIGARVILAVLDLPEILPQTSFDHRYSGIAKYPAMTRDISMVVPSQVLAGQIEEVIEKRGGKILEDYQLFDIYEGAQIGMGFKSMAYSLTFRNKEKTLEEADVSAAMEKILGGLEELGVVLRK